MFPRCRAFLAVALVGSEQNRAGVCAGCDLLWCIVPRPSGRHPAVFSKTRVCYCVNVLLGDAASLALELHPALAQGFMSGFGVNQNGCVCVCWLGEGFGVAGASVWCKVLMWLSHDSSLVCGRARAWAGRSKPVPPGPSCSQVTDSFSTARTAGVELSG